MRELPCKALLGFIVVFVMTNVAGKLEAKHTSDATRSLLQRYIESSSEQSNVECVGAALNVLHRFGDLSLIFHTVPRNDIERWLFRIELHHVMKNITVIRNRMTGPPFKFQIMLCKSIKCLLRFYFRRFRVKGVDESWKAFSSAWSNQKISRTMGISERLLNDSDSTFAILKLEVLKDSYKLKNRGQPLDRVHNLFNDVVENDINSIINFHKGVGTHYIESYTTGDFLFQVLQVDEQVWDGLRRFKYLGTSDDSPMTSLRKRLDSTSVKSAGKIMVASGDLSMSKWVNNTTLPASDNGETSLPGLVTLVSNKSKLDEFLRTSRANAIVQLRLNLLEETVNSSSSQKRWYEEVTHGMLALMENNI